MIGLAGLGGTQSARADAERMLGTLAGRQRSIITPWDGTAIGIARGENGFAADIVDGGATSVSVLFAGEVFDDAGPAPHPARRVLELYDTGRIDELAFWNGSFAVILADPRKRQILLATDRVGHRPFFTWSQGDKFSLATRLPALLADARVPRRLSRQGIGELLSFQRTFGEHTQYADIRSMPAASLWTFGNGRLETKRVRKLAWRGPEFSERDGPHILAEAFVKAVTRRVSGRGRVGLLLSGGLDARAILGAAQGAGFKLPCATASSHENTETRIARQCAAVAGAPFRLSENTPSMLSARFDAATRACDGLFSAPVNMFGMWPELETEFDAMLSGHAFDYTFRGYYLPCAFMQIGRSPTRLPILKAIPDGRPETVARMQRIGIPAAEASSIFSEKMAGSLTARRTAAVAHALEGCEPRSPYDAWDGFIMHTLGRHYAYSDFVAMETSLIHRPPAYDHGVFDIYLAMPPQWRASGTIVRRAMRLIAPQLMQLPDANTGVKAAMPFWTQLGLGYLKAGARRAGLLASPANVVPGTTQGSWSDYDVLFRTDPEFVARLDALTRSELIADTGLFDMKRLAAKIGEHRDGKIKFKRVLWQLLTVESWLRQFGYSGVGDD